MVEQQELENKLTLWLANKFPERKQLMLSPFSAPEAGASNQTLLFAACWQQQGQQKQQALVLRMAAFSEGIFPEYDMELQYRTMQRLQQTPVKVPVVVAIESDPEILGKPFYIMEQLTGRYLADNPPYQMEGWLTEQPEDIRRQIWKGGIEQIAEINRVDWRQLGFSDLWDSQQYETPLQQLLAYYEGFLNWAEFQGRPFPKLYPVLQYLKDNQPSNEPIALCWGDAKPPNLMIDKSGATIIGVLDWEMVHLGNPVHDLAWWFVLDDSLTKGLGMEKLAGLPDRNQMIVQWQEQSGFSAEQLDYYELLANFQFAVIMHRVGTLLTAQGFFKVEDEFDLNNNATLLIDEQIIKFGIA